MDSFIENGFEIKDIANILEVLPGQGSNSHTNRRYHGFVYYFSADHEYVFLGGSRIHVVKGSVLYLPEGSTYTIHRNDERESHCIAINFYASQVSYIEPFLYVHQSAMFQDLFERALRARLMLRRGYRAQTFACLYGIIAALQLGLEGLRPSAGVRHKIKPGVDWMEAHFSDPFVSISLVAKLCGISDAHFRNLFQQVHGTPPLRYLHTLRLNYANELISSGEYSVSQAAERAGFTDISTFYRLFRRVYGTTPLQLNRKTPSRKQ